MDRGSNVIPACRPVHTLNQNPSNNDHSNPQKIPSKTLTIFQKNQFSFCNAKSSRKSKRKDFHLGLKI